MKQNERLEALQALICVVQNHDSLSQLTLSTPLVRALCFGVCRHYFRLEVLANLLVKKRPKEIEIWIILLMGLYQLHYMRIPDYAVVKETVSLAVSCKKVWAKGLINAVLRNFCRQEATLLEKLASHPAFIYGHPEWLIARIKQAWHEHWQAILQANDQHPPMNIRVNRLHHRAEAYLATLQASGKTATRIAHTPSGIALTTPCEVHELPGFAEGEVSIQDGAAQLAATLLDLIPGLRVLDACAAPGGKTGHILETEPHLAACVALDVEPTRMTKINENLARLRLNLPSVTVQLGNALDPNSWWDGLLFDRILLDAPCSATGVIRRHPDIKLLRTADSIQTVVKLQHELLTTLWPLLAKGGKLVYATCSILPEENEKQIARFVAEQANCQCLIESKPWAHATGHGFQLLPGEQGCDGFFYAILIKT